jgi:hypothetical protein
MRSFSFDAITEIPMPLFVFGSFLVLILIFMIFCGVLLVYKHIQNRSLNNLKQSMLDKGMSAQDIEQVLNAGVKPD